MPFLGLTAMFLTCTSPMEDEEVIDFEVQNSTLVPCVDDDPITRVVNNGTATFDLNVLDSDGVVLVSIPNIPPSSTTSWASFPQGEVLFELASQTTLVSDDKVIIQMDNCMAFDIEVNSSNQIVSYIPTSL